MKKVLRKKTARGMRFLIAAFVLTACFWNVSVGQPCGVPPCKQPCVTQSGCFVIDNAPCHITKQDPPCSGPCTTNGSNCNNCWNFTIYACGAINPDSFKITSEGGCCFSVCSSTGEFLDPDGRTDCDPNVKWPGLVLGHPPITTTQGATLTICAAPGCKIHITLVAHSELPPQVPCTSPCADAIIQF